MYQSTNHIHTQQGGGRKGLPQSFLNRFTKVVVDPLTAQDLRLIALDKARRERGRGQQMEGGDGCDVAAERVVEAMVAFNFRLAQEAGPGPEQAYGQKGGPWEFNLRDVFRWAELQAAEAGAGVLLLASSCDGDDAVVGMATAAALTVETAYLARLRERGDRRAARRVFEEVR
jgi:midasin